MGNISESAIASRRAVLTAVSGVLLTGAAAAGAPHMAELSQASPDFELIELCAKFDALQRQWLANFQPGESFDEELARIPLNESIEEAQSVLIDRIFEIRAITIEGIRARARTALLYDPELLNEKSFGGWNDIMAAALIRDLVGEK